jgi:hypothetical protein
MVEEFYGTRYQSDSFSLIDVGSEFHCLRSFFFFLNFRARASPKTAPPKNKMEVASARKESYYG